MRKSTIRSGLLVVGHEFIHKASSECDLKLNLLFGGIGNRLG